MDVAMTIKQRLRDPSLFVERAYVGGEWIDAAGEATIDVVDPATGTSIGAVPALGAAETRQAIAAADAAWAGWRAQSAGERARLLMRWHDLMLEHQEDLAVIVTVEQGKPLAESRGEIVYGASFVKWFAEEARRVYGDVIPAPGNGGAEGASRCLSCHHALEFPQRDDHAQMRAGIGGWMPHRHQTF
jgi:succinate-semialdehyde dehydrogenase / glutarate-semialdehyde dehydrogenase